MSKWPMVPLGEVLKRQKEEVDVEEFESYKRLTIRLNGNGIVVRDQLPGAEIGTKRQFRVHTGQLVLSKIDARNGAFGILPAEGNDAIITGNFWAFDHLPSRLDIRFLDYFTKTAAFVDLCIRASEGTTNRLYLQEDLFLEMEIPLPPLSEQQKIIEWIDAVATRVDEAKTIRTQLVAESTALLHSLSRTVLSEVPGETHTIDEVCETIIDCLHSNPVYSDEGIPTIRSPDVEWGSLNLEGARKTDQVEYERRTRRGEPQEDDIIVVREGGGTGKAGIVLPGQRFSLGQRVMMLRPDQKVILPRFLLLYWLSPLIQEQQIQERMKGSASPHLNIGATKQFPVVVPDLDTQRRLVASLDDLRDRLSEAHLHSAEANIELESLLPSVLNQVFNGGDQ